MLRARRWARWILALVGLAWAGFYLGAAPWMLGTAVVSRRFPERNRDASKTPASFGLAYEDVTFTGPGGVGLQGWWVPAAADRGTAILLHGLNRSRGEMADKLEFLSEQGWNALLYDQRRHGESGGEATTFGWLEREDALAAVALARERSGAPIVLWGISLGGATATLAAAEDPGVAGLICDSSFRSLPDTVAHHLRLFRRARTLTALAPTWPTVDLILFWMGRRGGFDPAALDIVAAARHLAGRPSLFVCNSDDRRMPQQIAFDLKEAAGDRSRVLVVPGESHGGAWQAGTAAYAEAVRQLLEEVSPASRENAAADDGRMTSAVRAAGAGGFGE